MTQNPTPSSRRTFLNHASAAAAVLSAAAPLLAKGDKTIKPGVSARSASRVVGANDRIHVGMIGVGGMGTVHLQAFMKQTDEEKDIQIVAVSDVYTKRKQRARDIAKLTDQDVHHDYRDLLARSDVDAVLIAAPDHWHGQMALDALAAGKDVYLEKPMTHTLEEARALVDAVKKYNRILQVGNQGLSAPGTHKSKELIDAGEIGPILCAQATSARNSLLGEWNYRVDPEGTPQNIDWNRWLGSAPKRPFNADRYFRFRKYWDYSGGIATDLFFHALGPILYPMGAQFPTRVSASGGIYVHKDREVPDTYSTVIEYPNFYIEMSGSMANAGMGQYHKQAIYGHKGTLVIDRNQVLVYPETYPELRQRSQPAQARPEAKVFELPPQAPQRDARTPHTTNFFACVRSRKQPNAPAELGYQIISAIKLGVYAYREGKTKLFDPKTQKVIEKAAPRTEYQGDSKNHTVQELGIQIPTS
ncbi:MAG: Gfo/Idh/MocA family oxidoreductase [Candidatus Sulfopaludibacter sp.]|nr:Gfo/Idh/MocA family oxidoreductase [Candidatus Sulfopaludibacter sp.]